MASSTADGDSDYNNTTLYTGQTFDPAIGLYYYRHRVYHAQLGLFVSRDPVGYVDGASLYCYAASGPVDLRDPLGTVTLALPSLPFIGGGGAAGAGGATVIGGGGAAVIGGGALGYGLYKVPWLGTETWLEPGFDLIFLWGWETDQPPVPTDQDDEWGKVCCECESCDEYVRYDTMCNLPVTVPLIECCDTVCPKGTTLSDYYTGVCQDYTTN